MTDLRILVGFISPYIWTVYLLPKDADDANEQNEVHLMKDKRQDQLLHSSADKTLIRSINKTLKLLHVKRLKKT